MNTKFAIRFATLVLSIAVALGIAPTASAATYYVSNSSCSDGNLGTSSSAPWCTFTNINSNTFNPGDIIYLARGSTWNQELDLKGTGSSTQWITVEPYGSGNYPAIVNPTSGQCVLLTNPDYWNIIGLTVENAGTGIHLYFTTNGHNGVYFHDINASGITGYAGIYLSIASGLTVSGSSYTLNGLTITMMEGSGNYSNINLEPARSTTLGAAVYGLQNVLMQNLYLHDSNATGEAEGAVGCTGCQNVLIQDSVMDNNGGTTYVTYGTIGMYTGWSDNYTLMNSVVEHTPVTSPESNDGGGWDNEWYSNQVQFYGDYFNDNAGAGIEFLAIHGSGDYDSNNVVNSNMFRQDGLGSASASEGSIYTAGTSDVPTGTASNNLYYEQYGFDVVAPSNGSFSGFTFTNNLQADLANDMWNSTTQFSDTQGQNQWSYQYYNGTSWSNMAYTSYINLYWSDWTSGTGAGVWASRMLPDACGTCWVGRIWTAPKAGNISIRGWAAKHDSGGSGVKLGIAHYSGSSASWIWGPTTLGGTDMTGFSTNYDLTVAQGDQIYFQLNNNSSGNNTDDTISWAPNIIYR